MKSFDGDPWMVSVDGSQVKAGSLVACLEELCQWKRVIAQHVGRVREKRARAFADEIQMVLNAVKAYREKAK